MVMAGQQKESERFPFKISEILNLIEFEFVREIWCSSVLIKAQTEEWAKKKTFKPLFRVTAVAVAAKKNGTGSFASLEEAKNSSFQECMRSLSCRQVFSFTRILCIYATVPSFFFLSRINLISCTSTTDFNTSLNWYYSHFYIPSISTEEG